MIFTLQEIYKIVIIHTDFNNIVIYIYIYIFLQLFKTENYVDLCILDMPFDGRNLHELSIVLLFGYNFQVL